jgi:geranylgeranyl pyrophosphate synthase
LRFQPIVLMVVLLALVSPMSLGQSASDPQNPPTKRPPIPGRETAPEDDNLARQMKEMAKRANLERQVQLKRDTDKLFQLSTELKQYVDKTNENVLSLDVLKKAEEIEKLAHNIKTRMKGNN